MCENIYTVRLKEQQLVHILVLYFIPKYLFFHCIFHGLHELLLECYNNL